MTKDEIQFWMLIAFAVAFVLSSYKIYIMFNTPIEGTDTQTQHLLLEEIILDFLKQIKELESDTTEVYETLIKQPVLQEEQYKNFNLNRFNQLLQKLYIRYEVTSLTELIQSIKNEE